MAERFQIIEKLEVQAQKFVENVQIEAKNASPAAKEVAESVVYNPYKIRSLIRERRKTSKIWHKTLVA